MSESMKNEKETTNIWTKEDVDDMVEYYGFSFYQIYLLMICGIVWACDAIEIMLLSIIIPTMEREWGITSMEQSLLVGIVFVGMIFGAFIWGYTGDNFGRKISIQLMLVLTAVLGLLSALAVNIWMLIIIRGMVGFAVAGSENAFIIMSESLSKKWKGIFLFAIEGFWTVGVVLITLVGWMLLGENSFIQISHEVSWRLFMVAGAVPSIFVFFLTFFMLESPQFNAEKGKFKEVEKYSRYLSKFNCRPNFSIQLREKLNKESEIDENQSDQSEIDEMEQSQQELNSVKDSDRDDSTTDEETSTSSSGFSEGIKNKILDVWYDWKPVLTPTLISSIILWFGNSFLYYGVVVLTTELFEDPSASSQDFGSLILVSFSEVPGLMFGIFLILFVRAKTTLIICAALLSVGFGLFLLPIQHIQYVPLGLAIFIRSLGMAASCGVWVYATEIFDPEIRGRSMGISNTAGRLGGFITPFIANWVYKQYKWAAIIVFIMQSLIVVIFTCISPRGNESFISQWRKSRKAKSIDPIVLDVESTI